jgi:mannose-6-phosphate isomerase-like protein (cupin superfamily)
VKWAPYVFELASDHGLVLLESGRLVDTAKGEAVPAGAAKMQPTTADEARRLRVPTLEEARSFVVTPDEFDGLPEGPLSSQAGVREHAVIGPASEDESLAAGKLDWQHGFQLRRLELSPGAKVALHRRKEAEVLFLHDGDLEIAWSGGSLNMGKGDTLTIPVGLERSFSSSRGATVFVVRGGDGPSGPQWLETDQHGIG